MRFIVLALLVCAGFAGMAQPPELMPVVPRAPTTRAQPASPVAQPMNEELQSILKEALAEAARRTQRDESSLQVVSAEAVTWPDGSLGCPTPGGMVTMALVPGYRIVIQAGGDTLDYHASRRGQLLLCPPGRAVEPRKNEWK